MLRLLRGACAALVLVALVSCASLTKASVHLAMPDLQQARDGVWEGRAEVGPVLARVAVTVADHRMTQVAILEHRKGLGGPAEVLATRMVERQSVDLDAVAGATSSSFALLKAGQAALEKAGGQP